MAQVYHKPPDFAHAALGPIDAPESLFTKFRKHKDKNRLFAFVFLLCDRPKAVYNFCAKMELGTERTKP